MADFNFLPWRDQRRELRKRRFWYGAAYVFAAVGSVFVMRVYLLLEHIEAASAENHVLRAELVELEPALAERRALQQQLMNRESLLAQVQSLRSRAAPLATLELVSAALPPAASYSAIRQNGELLYLSGEATGADLSLLMQALSANAAYASLVLDEFSPASDGSGVQTFVLGLAKGDGSP